MAPRHFSKIYSNPYFATKHYEESKPGQIEKKVEKYISYLFHPFRKQKNKKDADQGLP